MTEYRLIHFNCARPLGDFSPENDFIRTFIAIMPRIFADANEADGLHWHNHGVRTPKGEWLKLDNIFPYPANMGAPDVSTLAAWESPEALRRWAHNGRTHPISMVRLKAVTDHTQGESFVMWWQPRGQIITLEDGWQRLQQLRKAGPSAEAFNLASLYAKPRAA